MKRSILTRAVALGLLASAACGGGETPPVVAEAAGAELSVDEVVTMLASENYPNEVQVPYTLAELWVDYMLLARAVAENRALDHLDVSQIMQQQEEQELIFALREQEVRPDTVVTEEEIQSRVAELSPGSRVRARHIFLATPPDGTPVQKDSVRALAASLRDRIVQGESFEELARRYSNDPGTAQEGGDLGFVSRNELFSTLDSVVFALQPGELSDVVESVYGVHVVRVEERQTPSLEEVRPQVRSYIQQERVRVAESLLIASVEEGAGLEVQPGSVELVRRAAENPGMRLSRRARNRPLVTYRGGALTMGEVVAFMRTRASQDRLEIFNAADPAIEQNLLLALAQRELLAAEARERGLGLSAARRDSLERSLRETLVAAATELGLTSLPTGNDDVAASARRRHVLDLLREMLRGTRDVTPLGAFSFILREEYGGQVSLPALQLVVQRIQQVRGSAPPIPQDSIVSLPPSVLQGDTLVQLPAPGAPSAGGQAPPPDGG